MLSSILTFLLLQRNTTVPFSLPQRIDKLYVNGDENVFVAVKIVFTIWPLAILEKGIAVQLNIFASS